MREEGIRKHALHHSHAAPRRPAACPLSIEVAEQDDADDDRLGARPGAYAAVKVDARSAGRVYGRVFVRMRVFVRERGRVHGRVRGRVYRIGGLHWFVDWLVD